MPSNGKLILSAVGDIAAAHRRPEAMFDHVSSALAKGDVNFAQNERHYTNVKLTPVGGFTEQVPPENAAALKKGHFDIISFASNHTMDLGEETMVETMQVLRDQGFTVIGAGRNIAEARKPAIVERNGIKLAMLAYCSVLRPNYEAGANKPGCAPMRAYTLYHQADYQPGTEPRILTFANKDDLRAVTEDIRQARKLADVVAVSFHWGVHLAHGVIADYEKEVAHAAIDAGADIILGSHAHILKGIEVYKGKPIFYSMGNFAFDLPAFVLDEWVETAPNMADFFRDHGFAYGDPEWAIYTFPEATRKSMIVRCTFKGKSLERAAFVPVMINQRAQPTLPSPGSQEFEDVVSYMRDISAHQRFSTKFHVEGDEVVVDLA